MQVEIKRGRAKAELTTIITRDPQKAKSLLKKEPSPDKPAYCVIEGNHYLLVYAKETDEDNLRKVASKVVAQIEELKITSSLLELPEGLETEKIKAIVEGILLSAYSFDKYKNQENSFEVEFFLDLKDGEWKAAEEGKAAALYTNYVRDLVNEPPNNFPPERFIEEARTICNGNDSFKVKWLKGEKLLKEKFIGTYTVGKGSKNEPIFLHISYRPENSKKRLAFVGKGITFDSGGLSLKPQNFMETMKMDKAGACCLIGLLKFLKEQRPKVAVDIIIPSAENMPDGSSYRPDDIITFRNGKSVEIHSTDAEGRLLLADGLIYASELRPDAIINVATLTGACVVALGKYTAGVFSNDNNLQNSLLELSKKSGEKMWPLPLDEDLKEDLKTPHADIRNNGKSRYGGAITAALFLKEFVAENIPWAHIDIAGPAYIDTKWKYYRDGATGIPLRTLINFVRNYDSLP
ncbi:leucyl aminopeptidase [Thermosulfidibacter takaii ABI70S6]|uniref:Probable cytosol aminopeptidase n=1 Tax=Thermosulfidibacter takaii (strain DSM 17441 / JCM 13301 / NBRC 103674 / ABI70S6) TaxID=1298851 RepID=A0A0S3QTH9_THET7|nr:leucyl aminopeptidase [Thermosulfidibacter takaii]BAT71623.1 leucyl aminopeptidase [Thermosulfidibacter takaii ABI70S6]